jgi:Ser/Thr protein kinase RdoA (MazF antagonist)
MMKLSTLWSVDRTIDPVTHRSPIANDIALHWEDIAEGSLTHVRSSANFVFAGRNLDDKRVFFRFASTTERSVGGIFQEMKLLDWLADEGVAVPERYVSTDGLFTEQVETPAGSFVGVLFGEAPGKIRQIEDLGTDDYRVWGAVAGELHSRLWEAPIATAPQPDSVQTAIARALAPKAGTPRPIARAAQRLKKLLLSTRPAYGPEYGIIHGDLELDNLIWGEKGITIIDFDGANESWYLLDVAKALSDAFGLGLTVDSAEIAAFLQGYREFHPLTVEQLVLLPEFRTLCDLITYMDLAFAVDIEPEAAEADWMRDLILRFHEGMTGIEARIR